MTFREQMSEILVDSYEGQLRCSECPRNPKKGRDYTDCKGCTIDRILSAHNAELDRIAEEVPPCAFVYDADNVVKAYIQAQKEEM